jgi:hypothetical protein
MRSTIERQKGRFKEALDIDPNYAGPWSARPYLLVGRTVRPVRDKEHCLQLASSTLNEPLASIRI